MYKLFFNDTLDQMDLLIKEGIRVDAVITDIPYGTTKCLWDVIIPFGPMWDRLSQMKRNKNTPVILFGQEPFSSLLRASNLSQYKYDCYWEKERLTNIAQVKNRPGKVIETISVFYEKQCFYDPQMVEYSGPKRGNKVKNGKMGVLTDSQKKPVFEYRDNGLRYPTQILKFKRDILKENYHDTQKPVALMEYLVKTYTKPGDTILDFTCGSGSTGIAAIKNNRNFIGIDNGRCDKDNKYYGWTWVDVTEDRIKKIKKAR